MANATNHGLLSTPIKSCLIFTSMSLNKKKLTQYGKKGIYEKSAAIIIRHYIKICSFFKIREKENIQDSLVLM